jgi:gliding motility-associated-like protein
VACLADGSENVVSEEFCTELINDIPIITNVSVFVTGISNGADSIIWSMPKDLDTLQYSPPYQYRIYRSDGFNSASALIGATGLNNTLAFTDTFFIDASSLNTEEKPYTYKVELMSNNVSVGFTNNASSVFLSSAPTDNALQLTWQEQVPWANSKYFVYKQNSLGGFDLLSTVSTPSYKDTGLVNGEEYCYYIQSFGTYSSPGIRDTILNNSQVHCNKPFDNVPPCAMDTLIVEGDCNLFQNTLTWNNPENDCADDIVGYKIYYTPLFGGELAFIQQVNSSSDTSFLNGDLNSIAGCYAVSSIDTNLNESPLSDTVCVDNCPAYELPNIFIPGGDGQNDFFRPFPYKFVAKIYIQVFNRWGQLVFESTDPDILWDGRHLQSKKMCPAGVYYYVCQVHEIRLAGIETRTLKGYVHLVPENGGGAQPSN